MRLGNKSMDEWVAQYATSHQNPFNRFCHTVGIPLIALSIPVLIAAIWIRGAMVDLPTSLYFSAVTYTTTGYGDLVLPEEWRLVGGVEALTGILMCGLSTGMFFVVFSDIFGLNKKGAPLA